MGFLEILNDEMLKNNSKVKLNSVLFDTETEFTTFKFQYNQESFSEDEKKMIDNLISSYFTGLKFETKFKKYFFEKKLILMQVFDYIKQQYSSIIDSIKEEDIFFESENSTNLVVKVNSANYEYLESVNFIKELKEYLDLILFDDVSVKLIQEDRKTDESKEILADRETVALSNIYSQIIKNEVVLADVTKMEEFIGEKIEGECFFPEGLKTEAENINITGVIKYIKGNKFKSKRKNAEGEEIEKDYFVFELCHKSTYLRCVYFPKIADVEKVKTLVDNQKIVANGKLELQQDKLSFKVKNISLCDYEEKVEVEPEIEFKKANENYVLIKPEPYHLEEQANFFTVKKEPSEFLKAHDFVVFDLETTGTECPPDEITEIGAVKVRNGKIIETFTTLVKPKQSISETITKITGIDDELVKNAPSIAQVLPDFYKFCDGAVLVAYNIPFDYKFINHYGLQIGYKFDNPQIDAMYLARVGVPGLTRFRLKDVVERLNISLVNAHRALNDTVATAKVFIELSDFGKDLI